jgi:hypothetical protein
MGFDEIAYLEHFFLVCSVKLTPVEILLLAGVWLGTNFAFFILNEMSLFTCMCDIAWYWHLSPEIMSSSQHVNEMAESHFHLFFCLRVLNDLHHDLK